MWETHCSVRDNFGLSSPQIEYMIALIQNIRGVYGARIIGQGYSGLLLVLVGGILTTQSLALTLKYWINTFPKGTKTGN